MIYNHRDNKLKFSFYQNITQNTAAENAVEQVIFDVTCVRFMNAENKTVLHMNLLNYDERGKI